MSPFEAQAEPTRHRILDMLRYGSPPTDGRGRIGWTLFQTTRRVGTAQCLRLNSDA
jgi:hypothetical protein